MKKFESCASRDFCDQYDRLPATVRKAADKQFARFRQDPSHPSLHLKPAGEVWSVRVTEAYRARAIRQENTFYWFWIGRHDEYERLIG